MRVLSVSSVCAVALILGIDNFVEAAPADLRFSNAHGTQRNHIHTVHQSTHKSTKTKSTHKATHTTNKAFSTGGASAVAVFSTTGADAIGLFPSALWPHAYATPGQTHDRVVPKRSSQKAIAATNGTVFTDTSSTAAFGANPDSSAFVSNGTFVTGNSAFSNRFGGGSVGSSASVPDSSTTGLYVPGGAAYGNPTSTHPEIVPIRSHTKRSKDCDDDDDMASKHTKKASSSHTKKSSTHTSSHHASSHHTSTSVLAPSAVVVALGNAAFATTTDSSSATATDLSVPSGYIAGGVYSEYVDGTDIHPGDLASLTTTADFNAHLAATAIAKKSTKKSSSQKKSSSTKKTSSKKPSAKATQAAQTKKTSSAKKPTSTKKASSTKKTSSTKKATTSKKASTTRLATQIQSVKTVTTATVVGAASRTRYDAPAQTTALTLNNVNIVGTFSGQGSPYLPTKPFIPSGHTDYATDYATILGDSLWFYEVQRSGLLDSLNNARVPWRNNSGLRDGTDNKVDLTGGFYDAGDYLKFTFPMASSMAFVIWGAIEHPDGYIKAGQLGYLDQMVRWGMDWLVKCHPSPNVLYVQVGDGNVDNNYWGGDQGIPTPRPSYFISASAPGTDVAAGTAAAFAAASILYSTVLNDQNYAAQMLSHAVQLWNFADTAKKTLYQKSVPAAAEWYASSDFSDELVWAALWMYKATGTTSYLNRAEYYFKFYSVGEGNNLTPSDWDGKYGVSYLLGAQIAKTTSSAVDWLGTLQGYLAKQFTITKTPGGLVWFGDSSSSASLVVAANTAFTFLEYARLFPTSTLASKYLAFGNRQFDYIFGQNPKSIPYLVGISAKSPKNPQSAMASGGEDIGNIDKSPLVELRTLYGAMVGGPAKDDSFLDQRSNWKQSEVALDYNSLLQGMLSAKVALGETPYYMR